VLADLIFAQDDQPYETRFGFISVPDELLIMLVIK
jgi:hypothetical protein